VISIIGVVSMQSSSLQEKFSRNVFYNVQSFQAAVNEQSQQYSSASSDEDLLLDVLSEDRTLDALLTVRHAVMESTISYAGEGLPPSGYSLGKYRGLRFSIDTKSTYENIDAISDQTLGFQYAAPKSI
ncbi:MAG: pilus assembly PilX N-terminal domain-containing protein, partial [Pseudomonadales bacterium]|nr:pilus assembly PilX N-terminal domain-containing protein [Pseudomonadales bacterium]